MIKTLMGNISSAFGYYKDNQNSTQKDITPFDVKLLVMNIMNKITLYKNQKTNFFSIWFTIDLPDLSISKS